MGLRCFLLLQKKFYGPQRRKMMFMGFVRLGVWYNFFRARNGGFSGNLEGEGFILGGVFVVGPGKQVSSSCSCVDLWVSASGGTRPRYGGRGDLPYLEAYGLLSRKPGNMWKGKGGELPFITHLLTGHLPLISRIPRWPGSFVGSTFPCGVPLPER